MVEELTGKVVWGLLLAASLAEHIGSAEKHICGVSCFLVCLCGS